VTTLSRPYLSYVYASLDSSLPDVVVIVTEKMRRWRRNKTQTTYIFLPPYNSNKIPGLLLVSVVYPSILFVNIIDNHLWVIHVGTDHKVL
jgi:hypothetical protein